MGITLDAGALIAFERDDREVRARVVSEWKGGGVPTVPTPVLAQAWRDGRRQVKLAKLLRRTSVQPLDEELAKRAGELMARAGTSDAIDAIVALSAATRRDIVLTSDPTDLKRLAEALGGRIKVIAI